MTFFLHDTILGKREFVPVDSSNIRIYYCGPTVYDFVHIGNLRAFLTADILVRTLRSLYPKVTFVRNITDIDDKIIERARENRESIRSLTNRTINIFHEDINKMGLIPPDIEPKATDHIPEMILMIEKLLEKGHAYIIEDDISKSVYFDTSSYDKHGHLSKRENMRGESHILNTFKKNVSDFVLWKPSLSHQPWWDSPWGKGRPGWHLECSAMSNKYLGELFDIHGGGQDLLFPHHENENAQSVCSSDHKHEKMANYWVHNSMLLVNGKKMSKSENNFLIIRDILSQVHPEVLKLFLLTVNYRSELNFTCDGLNLAKKHLNRFYKAVEIRDTDNLLDQEALSYLYNDLDTPGLLAYMYELSNKAFNGDITSANKLYSISNFIGLLKDNNWFHDGVDIEYVEKLIQVRNKYKMEKDWNKADAIRSELNAMGIILEDTKAGTQWRKD